jgi:drug/metabolite transporter (DMT)-like permease
MVRPIYLAQGAAAGILFGTASIFIRMLTRMDALSLGFVRLSFASLFMLAVAVLFYRDRLGEAVKFYGWRLLLLGIFLGFHFVFFIAAVKTTSIVNATTLVNTTPAFALAMAWALQKIKPARTNIIGLAVTLAGITALSLSTAATTPPSLLGDLSALAGAFFWAAYLTYGFELRARVHPIAATPSLYMVSALVLALSGLLAGGGLLLPQTSEIPPLIALAFLPTVLGHTFHFSSLKGLRPYEASTLALLEPVAASTLALIIFGEVLTPVVYLSAAVLIFGIYLVVR